MTMDRAPLTDPTAPLELVYVLAAVALMLALAWLLTRLQLDAARQDLDVARAELHTAHLEHSRELQAETDRRVAIDRSRTDAQLEAHKLRALNRTLADELDKRTMPHGWTFRPGDDAQALEVDLTIGVDTCPEPGCGTEMATTEPGVWALTHHADGSHTYGPRETPPSSQAGLATLPRERV